MQRQGRLRRIRTAQGLPKNKQTVRKGKGGCSEKNIPFFYVRYPN
jgi:hypothetical protein